MSFVLYRRRGRQKNIDTATAPVYIHALQEFGSVTPGLWRGPCLPEKFRCAGIFYLPR